MVQGQELEAFIEDVLRRIHDLNGRGVMADIFIHLGRRDKKTGQPKPPHVSHHEH